MDRSVYLRSLGAITLVLAIPAAMMAAQSGSSPPVESASAQPPQPQARSSVGPPVPRPPSMALDQLPAPKELGSVPTSSPQPAVRSDASARGEDKEVVRRGLATGGSWPADPQRAGGRPSRAASSWRWVEAWPLLAVLALMAGLGLLFKRFLPGRRLFTGAGVMQVVARTPISAKQQLMLVKLGRRLVLLGVSPERMNTLATVDDPDQVATLLGEVASSRPDSMAQTFAQTFQQEKGAYVSEAIEQEPALQAQGTVAGLLAKVRGLSARRTPV